MYKSRILPPYKLRVYPEPILTYSDAQYERDCFMSEYDEHHPHIVIVEWESMYYVVYGKDNYKGFTEYDI
jgi:hypothetical protein